HNIYKTDTNTYKLVPVKPKFVNMIIVIIAFNNVPITNQGLNFPHLVLVLSTIIPITGSFTASHIRAAKNNVPTKLAATPNTSVKYNIKNVPVSPTTKSLPNAPIPNVYFALRVTCLFKKSPPLIHTFLKRLQKKCVNFYLLITLTYTLFIGR